MSMNAQLVIEGVGKVYRVDEQTLAAVREVSLTVKRGEMVAVIGHSGSGKTTLLSMIGGIARPDSGRVLFNGRDIHTMNSDQLADYRCDKVGFMFQFASLLPMLTARENLLLPAAFGRSRGKPDGRAEQKAAELLALVGLGDRLAAYPAQLSGGQQRRVAIARAFMNDPELILADEPTGDLDEETEQDILRIFREYNRQGTTFVVVTHNRQLAASQDNPRVVRMKQGLLQEEIGPA